MTSFRTNDISFLVVSCDAYSDLWHPFFSCFFKYWPDCPFPIYLASNNSTYPDERVNMINIGPDKDYSSNLISILDKIDTPWIFLWFEDAFLSKKVDNIYIKDLIKDAITNDVGSFKLSSDFPWVYAKDRNKKIGPIPKGVKYRGAIGMSLYKKELLYKLISPGESAWQLDKSNRSNELNEKFYALTTDSLKKPPFSFQHGVVKGKWLYSTPAFLKKEGLSNYIPNRTKESPWSYLYSKIYLFRLDIYRILGKYWYD